MKEDIRLSALLALVGLVLGLALGLVIAWVALPTRYVDTSPAALRSDFKEQYRAAIASAFNATGDLPRAIARLELLKDADSQFELINQVQRLQASGQSPESAYELAVLVQAIKEQGSAPMMIATKAQAVSATPTLTPAEPTLSFVSTPQPTNTPGPSPTSPPTFTPQPTQTPSPTPGQPFKIAAIDAVCSTDLLPGLLTIEVFNAARKPIAGMEIIITWTGGEEHIFTGLKPELGNGYADFVMQAGVVYYVRLARGGEIAETISPEECTPKEGTAYTGQVKLVFQQP